MNVKVLDCTLRDGAYIVDSNFGENHIKSIYNSLEASNIDIIECGWLKNTSHQKDSVSFNQPKELKDLAINKAASLMFNLGEFDFEKLDKRINYPNIIRISFYKKDLNKIEYAIKSIQAKGYQVFLQASNTLEYNNNELEKLCNIANSNSVDAIYIVDTFGSMFPNDLDRIMQIYSQSIKSNIEIGLHSHNNIQLSLALSIQFISKMHHNIIIDSSLCGIGRGVGNTQTEILLEYLNRNGANYKTNYIWQSIKNDIEPLFEKYSWKYNPKNGYKGLKGLHPNTNITEYL